jgi:hypothetical protein
MGIMCFKGVVLKGPLSLIFFQTVSAGSLQMKDEMMMMVVVVHIMSKSSCFTKLPYYYY